MYTMADTTLQSLLFTGEDHLAFLHRMFTHDLQALPEQAFRFAALCNHKGRVIANGLFLRQPEGTRMILPSGQQEAVMETLLRFRLRDRVEMQAETRCWTLTWQTDEGLPGEGALSALRLSPADETAHWADAACQAGLALVLAEERERHVPQTLNMDRAEGIHFNKGCYPGQEVVARLHYLGKPKNRTVHLETARPVSVGTAIAPAAHPTESTGSCILAGRNGHVLCTVKTAALSTDGAAFVTCEPEAVALTLAPLPYEL